MEEAQELVEGMGLLTVQVSRHLVHPPVCHDEHEAREARDAEPLWHVICEHVHLGHHNSGGGAISIIGLSQLLDRW
eukprot:CAMPEP_0174740586 /NCGR_PEP_ID=MMETSP1094-20130205/73973_1 /TAXON_ID=156173 /ORGANISM="Chrysochromulina brevifilum, Strain UTEX LB 985" /LENGTH=75 /DNA_ID=CAMNT_0015944313 /DNA_START=224 /DNA_END=451 /DNA_ORIENTATION=+